MPRLSSPELPSPSGRPASRLGDSGSAGDGSGYLSEQTIAALATAVGGAIAVIRVSGRGAFGALDALAGAGTAARAEPRKLIRATLSAPASEPGGVPGAPMGAPIDDALFACFRNPESYTGEDLVELHVHGGAFTASRVLEALLAAGVRQALPGEFSFRAVRNGKMSLDQAEAVADLIRASNEGAATLALEKLSGSQGKLLRALAEDLRKLCVLGEVGIDFADQDIDELSLPRLKERLAGIEKILAGLRDSFDRGSRLQEGVGVAFLGLPNAGKSSFFNALLGEDRSIVSEIPGTTRDVIREKITLRGPRGSVTLRLEDTAGLRQTSDTIESKGIARSHQAARSADIILFLADPTAPEGATLAEWRKLESSLGGAPLAAKTLGVLTKCDLVSEERLASLSGGLTETSVGKWLRTSSLTGEGISAAALEISDACMSWVSRQQDEILLTRLDQLNAVVAALSHLARARVASEIDLFAFDIRQALHALGPLIGETLPDDILGRIFSDFCIGK